MTFTPSISETAYFQVVRPSFLNSLQVITDFNQAMSEYQRSVFKELSLRFQDLMLNVNFKEKWDAFRQSKASNLQFEFFTIYTNMVRQLLEFIQASRARNWMQHLSAGEALMKDIISMDRIKYKKGFLVYLADMKNLQNSNEDIFKYFMEGNFSEQKSPISGVQ